MHALCLAIAMAAMQPPVVRYVISVETRTWKPIELKDVERILDNAAVSPLLQRGDMQLVKSNFADLKSGDYTLIVSGRFIEEAEDFSVYMTFGPGKRQDLPSFHVAGTEPVGKRGMQEMQRIMEKLANQVASRLNSLLAPELRKVDIPIVSGEGGEQMLPQLWQWPKVTAPDVPKPSKLVQSLIDPRTDDHERSAAVDSIATAAFDELPARKALERCVLRDPSPRVRIECVRALEPVARVNVQTQRVLLYAMRNEYDDQVLAAIARVSQSFTGLSRSEALDTWLFLVASPATPKNAMRDIADVLGKEGNVPNLDAAVLACLRQNNLQFGKKGDCSRNFLRILPPERRVAVIYDYLGHLEQADLNDEMTVKEAMEWLTRDDQKPTGKQCDLIASIATRATSRSVASSAAYILGSCADPTPTIVDRLVSVVNMQNGWWMTRPMSDMASSKPELRDHIIQRLSTRNEQLIKQGCVTPPHSSSTIKEINDTVKSLQKRR